MVGYGSGVKVLFPEIYGLHYALHSMHQNVRIFSIGEYFEIFDEMPRFMPNVEDNILHPSRGLIRRPHSMNVVYLIQDFDSESDSEDAVMLLNNSIVMVRYEPLLHPHSSPQPVYIIEGTNFVVPTWEYRRHHLIFHRAEDASTSSSTRAFVNEGKPDFKPYSHQFHHIMRSMGYNLIKSPTGLGLGEGILVLYTDNKRKTLIVVTG